MIFVETRLKHTGCKQLSAAAAVVEVDSLPSNKRPHWRVCKEQYWLMQMQTHRHVLEITRCSELIVMPPSWCCCCYCCHLQSDSIRAVSINFLQTQRVGHLAGRGRLPRYFPHHLTTSASPSCRVSTRLVSRQWTCIPAYRVPNASNRSTEQTWPSVCWW